MYELDNIDRNILTQLLKNARTTMEKLSQEVGLSKTPVITRIKRMEAEGIIRGYSALIDHTKVGAGHISFVQVTLSDTRTSALEAFNQAVGGIAEIVGCHMIAGNFDYLLKIRTRDMAHYRKVLAESLSELPHVSHTSTFSVMEAVKDR
jgi:Lrp/AsnC family leucine-responsive transcriptional regulator